MRRRPVFWLLPPILLGAAIAASSPRRRARSGSTPRRLVSPCASSRPRRSRIRPTAQGWGNIRAADTWTAIAEVRGTVIWQHPDLENGKLIEAGTKVLEIDPADYELAVAQAEADLAALAAEAAQIDALALEEARLAISEDDLTRTRELVAQGTAPQTRADEAERAVLAARRVVTELQNTLALTPSRREQVAAQRARTEAALARARRDLDHTNITVPFDLRVTQVEVELYQYVTVGQTLIGGDGIERVEVLAQIPVGAGHDVVHLMGEGREAPAAPTPAARSAPSGKVVYPAGEGD